MLAVHDQFTRHMRNRLQTTTIGLGLVRLLQDARRFDEAKTVLHLLETKFKGEPKKVTPAALNILHISRTGVRPR
jgi:hypothetical protein